MWVEEGEANSFAAMLVFFPEFKPPPCDSLEVVRLTMLHYSFVHIEANDYRSSCLTAVRRCEALVS